MVRIDLATAGRRIIAESVSPHPGVHASTVSLSPSGEIAVAWFDGPHEGVPGTRIRLARGHTWDDLTCEDISGPCSEPQWNPVVFWDDEVLTVYFQVGSSPATWRTFVSRRIGSEWVSEACISEGGRVRGPVRNHVMVRDSVLYAGSSVEDRRPWASAVDIRAPHAKFWRRELIPGNGAADLIQPALVWHRAQLLAFMRSSEGHAFVSRRDPDGSWSVARPVDLPNNNSAFDVASTDKGVLLAVANTSSENWGPRCPLVLYSSEDGCAWTRLTVVEDGKWFTGDARLPHPSTASQFDRSLAGCGEYSYPSIALLRDTAIISYTWQRRAIALARFLIPVREEGGLPARPG